MKKRKRVTTRCSGCGEQEVAKFRENSIRFERALLNITKETGFRLVGNRFMIQGEPKVAMNESFIARNRRQSGESELDRFLFEVENRLATLGDSIPPYVQNSDFWTWIFGTLLKRIKFIIPPPDIDVRPVPANRGGGEAEEFKITWFPPTIEIQLRNGTKFYARLKGRIETWQDISGTAEICYFDKTEGKKHIFELKAAREFRLRTDGTPRQDTVPGKSDGGQYPNRPGPSVPEPNRHLVKEQRVNPTYTIDRPQALGQQMADELARLRAGDGGEKISGLKVRLLFETWAEFVVTRAGKEVMRIPLGVQRWMQVWIVGTCLGEDDPPSNRGEWKLRGWIENPSWGSWPSEKIATFQGLFVKGASRRRHQ